MSTETHIDRIHPRPWSIEETWSGRTVKDATGKVVTRVRKSNIAREDFVAAIIVDAVNIYRRGNSGQEAAFHRYGQPPRVHEREG